MNPNVRRFMLVLDAVALVGVVAFSVGAALDRDNDLYLAGQIICVVLVLGSVLVLRQTNRHNAETAPPDQPGEGNREY